jgi:hypothetical protein
MLTNSFVKKHDASVLRILADAELQIRRKVDKKTFGLLIIMKQCNGLNPLDSN